MSDVHTALACMNAVVMEEKHQVSSLLGGSAGCRKDGTQKSITTKSCWKSICDVW